ncbi:hypothetical protein Tco_1394541 [Tanacetum coccineum]
MDPTSSLGRICLGENVYGSSSEKVERHRDWNAPEYTDTSASKEKKVTKALSFYKMETNKVSERYIAPCFVNGLEAYDGEINLAFDENLISNEYAVKLCLDYEEDGKTEVRPVLETMAYHDKYKKVLDKIWKDKVELDGMIVKEEEVAIKKVKGEALKEKDDPGAFIFPIRLEGKVNENALAYTGSDVLRTAESDDDDEEEYEIKRNKFGAPIYGPKPAAYLNCNDLADRSLALQATMGGNDAEAGSLRSKRSRKYETVEEVLLPQVHHEFLLWESCNNEAKSRYNTKLTNLLPRHVYSSCVMNWDILNGMGCDGEINDMMRIKLREAESNEEIFTSIAWIRAFNIKEPIYSELCHEFYSTYEFDEVCADDELQTKNIIKFRLGGRAHSLTLLEFACRLGLYHVDELDEDGFDVYF